MLEATFEIVSGRAIWGYIEGSIQDQTDLQEELESISGGLSDSIQAVDDKYDSITGALDDKIDSINGALSDSITAVDNKYDSITSGLSDSITAETGARENADSIIGDSITALDNKYDSITGGLSDSITALDNKYDSVTGALDGKIDSINGALSDSITALDSVVSGNFTTLSDSITALDSVVSSNYTTLDGKIDSINGALSDSITGLDTKYDSITGALDTKIDNHIGDTLNPHSVTKAQVGLGNCDNTSDANKPISTATQTALDGKVDKNTAITGATKCKITYDTKGLVTGGADLQANDIPSLTLSKISDVTATASELNILDGATITTAELNILDGATLSTTELNYVDGVTSSIQTQFGNITDLIPSATTTSNQLADKNFVNSSIATNTANFIGTFNSLADLEAYSGTLTNNDYAFVIVTDSLGNNAYDRYKYTTATTPASWVFEYELNNSSFTSDQWAAINSGITSATKVTHTANTAIGSSNTPVYINSNGAATALSYTIDKSVPSNAVFTDTTYTFATGTANGTIAVDGSDIAVKGLGSAAYTSSTDYATPTYVDTGLATKQDELTAGSGISIVEAASTLPLAQTLPLEVINNTVQIYNNLDTSNTLTVVIEVPYGADMAITPRSDNYYCIGVRNNGNGLGFYDTNRIGQNEYNNILIPTSGTNAYFIKFVIYSDSTSDVYYSLDGTSYTLALSKTRTNQKFEYGGVLYLYDGGSSTYNTIMAAYGTDIAETPTISCDNTIARVADIPTNNNQLTNGAGYITNSALTPYVLSSSLATVATSGSYNDLSDKPTIPTVNNATLTIQKNGSTVDTFTANASSDKTINITVPTDTGDLTNNAGFITSSAITNMQTTANLVTSVSSSSTDSQYPSAKLFYDTCGDIETLINAL